MLKVQKREYIKESIIINYLHKIYDEILFLYLQINVQDHLKSRKKYKKLKL